MQSWHDQGYFTPDLLMKRTQIDADWISVGELTHRAAGPKIFLSPLMTPALPGPPGLTRRPDNLNESNPFNTPHQPVPIRSLHTSTLNSYINGNSQSASPSSSAGPTSHLFTNPEPSINTIGGNRLPYNDSPIDGLGRSPFTNATATYGFNGKFLPPAIECSLIVSFQTPIVKIFLGTICNRQLLSGYPTPARPLINITAVLAHSNRNSAFPQAPPLCKAPFRLQPLQCNTTRTSSNQLLLRFPICPPTITPLLPHLGGHPIYH